MRWSRFWTLQRRAVPLQVRVADVSARKGPQDVKSIMIGYDLSQPGQNYDTLTKEIKGLANGFWHYLDSTWIIRTNQTPKYICDVLMRHIDSNDELLVAELTGSAAWVGFNTSGSDWLKTHL